MLPFFKPKKGFQLAGSGGGGGEGSIDTSALANKTDLIAIILTGTTNTSGSTITSGTWFYLNGKPCIAKVDIASGATFTEGTNYEKKTVGSALTELNSNSLHTTRKNGNFNNYIAGGYDWGSSSKLIGMQVAGSNGSTNNWSYMLRADESAIYFEIYDYSTSPASLILSKSLSWQ